MVLIFGAQNYLAMPQKSITQSSDWIGSCLIAKSKFTLNSESTQGPKIWGGGNILPPNSQICPLKTDRFFGCASKGPRKRPYFSARRGKLFKNAHVHFQFSNAGCFCGRGDTLWSETHLLSPKILLVLVYWKWVVGLWSILQPCRVPC